MKTNPTLRDVAALAGVSHQTVSRVINGESHVSPATRHRVETAIADLNYRPNAIARSMASGRSCMIASVAPNLVDFTFASNQEGAEFEARQHGYFLITSSAPTVKDFEDLLDELIGHRRVDGIIVFNPYLDRRHTLLPRDFPLVYVGGRKREDVHFSVYLDNQSSARQVVDHLIGLGHTSIAEITGPLQEDCAQERHNGYQVALRDHGISLSAAHIAEGDWSASAGYQVMNRWIREKVVPSAVFAQNDRMAIGVIRAARDSGLTIPGDLSVAGFDDMPLSSYFDPPLTTLRQDTYELGREAARLMIRIIEDRHLPDQHIRFPGELVIRSTTGTYGRR